MMGRRFCGVSGAVREALGAMSAVQKSDEFAEPKHANGDDRSVKNAVSGSKVSAKPGMMRG